MRGAVPLGGFIGMRKLRLAAVPLGFRGFAQHLLAGMEDRLGWGSRKEPVASAETLARFVSPSDLLELRRFLVEPWRFRELGATLPKGVLLLGETGVGATGLLRGLAAEAGLPLFKIAPREVSPRLGDDGADQIRALFRRAGRHRSALVVIDGIDELCRPCGRDGAEGGRGHALAQLLVEMDRRPKPGAPVVLGTTARPDALHPALLQRGRFDRRISLPLPTGEERLAILQRASRTLRLTPDADLPAFSRRTLGLTRGELEGLLNEAALIAGIARAPTIAQTHLEQALGA